MKLKSVDSGNIGLLLTIILWLKTTSILHATICSAHPCIFFNRDKTSFTFVGFIINKDGDLLDNHEKLLEHRIMSKQLYEGLKRQTVNLSDDHTLWSKQTMINKIATVMGLSDVKDPDETYVLTVDNVIKILAIQTRFRCGIPVVIMGETGCGKTRLIRYMCDLAKEGNSVRNMLILKVGQLTFYCHD